MKSVVSKNLLLSVCTLSFFLLAQLLPGAALADDNSDIKAVVDTAKKLNPADYNQLLDAFSERIRKNPRDAAARFGRGYILLRQKQYQQALPDTNCAMSLAPNSAEVFNLHGFICLFLLNYKGALTDFNRAIELDPEFVETYCARGVTQRHLGNYQAAIGNFSKALELKPNDAKAYTGRGTTYRAMNAYGNAIQDYDKSLQLSPNEEVEQLRTATINEQQVANARKGRQNLSAPNDSRGTAEDYGGPAANQYCDHLKKEPLLNFSQEFASATPNSQEYGYMLMVMVKRLPNEASESILETIAQLRPSSMTDGNIYWQLYSEAKNRNLDPFARVPPVRLAYFAHYFPVGSNNHLIFFGEVIQRLPKLSLVELTSVLGALPLSEVQLRDEVAKEIQSRRGGIK